MPDDRIDLGVETDRPPVDNQIHMFDEPFTGIMFVPPTRWHPHDLHHRINVAHPDTVPHEPEPPPPPQHPHPTPPEGEQP